MTNKTRAMTMQAWGRSALMLATMATAAAALSGCAAVLLGGAVMGTGLVATDRRTTGTQIEDEAIELKAAARVRELATLGHINVTSYNRLLLITGEVPGEAEKASVGAALSRVENVRAVANELGVGGNSTVGSRSTDTVISGKVKAAMVDAKDIQANAYKVVSERGIVYLMGRVTDREANRGADVARQVNGVQKVVKVFDLLTEDELANLGRQTTPAPVSGGASAPR